MPKIVSTDLFDLIRTMTPAEQNSFRSSLLNASNDARLFDAIVELDVYDESQLLRKFEGEKMTKSFHTPKNHLLNTLLSFLRSKEKDCQLDKVNTHLQNATLFESRGLYKASRRTLNLARRLAEQYEFFHILFLIHRRLAQFNSAQLDKYIFEETEKSYQEAMEQLAKLQEETTFARLQSLVNIHNSKMKKNQGKQTISQPFNFDMEQHPTTFNAQISYFTANAYYARSIKNFSAYNQHLLEAVDLWMKNPHQQEEQQLRYVIHLSNFLNSCLIQKDYDRFKKYFPILHTLKPDSYNVKAEKFANLYFIELRFCLGTFQFKQAKDLAVIFEADYPLYKERVTTGRLLNYYNNFAVLFFLTEDFEESLSWITRIRHSPKSEQRPDLVRFSKIFELILHYELDHLLLVESLLINAKKSLKRNGYLFDFEHMIFNHFKSLTAYRDQTERKTKFKAFLALQSIIFCQSKFRCRKI